MQQVVWLGWACTCRFFARWAARHLIRSSACRRRFPSSLWLYARVNGLYGTLLWLRRAFSPLSRISCHFASSIAFSRSILAQRSSSLSAF